MKVAGNLTEPLMGDSIRQYLKYTIVDHPYPISFANCLEFCALFGKSFERSTKIMHSDIIKLLRDYRLQGQPQDGLMIESALNPFSIQMRGWVILMRLVRPLSAFQCEAKYALIKMMLTCTAFQVALYHVFQVPIRIAFNPFPDFMSHLALASDGPMDFLLLLNVIVHLNTAYKSSRESILQIHSMICSSVVFSDFK